MRTLPERLTRRARLAWTAARIAADRESAGRLRDLGRPAELTDDSGQTVAVRLKPLGGREVSVRPATADVDTVWSTFIRRHHLPPPEAVERGLGRIWDLGCNAGLTMAHLASTYPGAEIVGVELDERNAELARRNLEPWEDRCRVIHAAAWPEDGEVWYHRWPGATSGYRVGDPTTRLEVEAPTAPSLSLGTLLEREGGPDRWVDYVKVDVEGAERELLSRSTGWAERVGSIKVEVHPPWSVEECREALAGLGFEARRDARHPACAIGVRPRPG